MTRYIPYFRLNTAALVALCAASISLAGCEFLGFDRGDEVIEINADDNDNNGEQQQADGTVTLFDEVVDLDDNYSDTITIEVPDNVFSIAISITEGSDFLNYGVTDWQHEEGFQLIPAGWESGGAQICYPNCNNRVTLGAGGFGALAPNNPDSQVEPGEYTFQVFSAAVQSGFINDLPGLTQSVPQVRVTVHAEVTDSDVPQDGTLDLNLFFSGAGDWTAESAQQDSSFQAMMDQVDDIYTQIGVTIGEVSYHDVDSSYQVIEDVFSGSGDLSQMFTLSEEGDLQAPAVFFVSELRSPFGGGGGGGILGIAGGIPGPMIVDGSPRSGVAIALDSVNQPGAPSVAHVVAHELGHYLGLFHTSENWALPGMPAHDPLPDTPEDDFSYLMHASGSGDIMSEWQGRVIRKNPWVNH